MGALLSSKVKLFRVSGIDVYLHSIFIIAALIEVVRGLANGEPGLVFAWLVALWVSVLLHEFGHCWGARKSGGDAHEVLLWPLGGLATVDAPMTPRAQFVTTAAGPSVNLILAGLATLVGWAFFQSNPLDLLLLRYDPAPIPLRVFVDANVRLFVFNMLPAFPMDMGRIFQVALWTRIGYQRSMRIACYLSFVCAAGLVVWALAAPSSLGSTLTLLVALFVIQGAYRELQLVNAGYYAELDEPWRQTFLVPEDRPSEPGFVARWVAQRREAREKAKVLEEASRALRLDDVLRRVAAVGMDGLTKEERAFLDLESARLRGQKRDGA